MIEILTWVSIFAGGTLMLLMLLSTLGGLDLDIDIGDSEVNTDSGGIGIFKGILTFVSVGSWVIKVLIASDKHIGIAITVGIVAGLLALILLHYIFKAMIRSDTYINWEMEDALFQKGKVYLKIPAEGGNGIVNVSIKGVQRELKATSYNNEEITTGSPITVMEIDGEYVKVQLDK